MYKLKNKLTLIKHILVQVVPPVYSQKLGFNKRTSWMIDFIKVKNVDKQKISGIYIIANIFFF